MFCAKYRWRKYAMIPRQKACRRNTCGGNLFHSFYLAPALHPFRRDYNHHRVGPVVFSVPAASAPRGTPFRQSRGFHINNAVGAPIAVVDRRCAIMDVRPFAAQVMASLPDVLRFGINELVASSRMKIEGLRTRGPRAIPATFLRWTFAFNRPRLRLSRSSIFAVLICQRRPATRRRGFLRRKPRTPVGGGVPLGFRKKMIRHLLDVAKKRNGAVQAPYRGYHFRRLKCEAFVGS